ncbi:glycerol transporter [Kappamyces sp. JEL0680]|nr:glycerol transporter [Kappamyces sp. JEL0680]
MRHRFGEWHLQICALGGLVSIWMMITANLVGFAVGIDGIQEMGSQLLQLSGLSFVVLVSTSLFSFVHIQFYVRAGKKTASRIVKTK